MTAKTETVETPAVDVAEVATAAPARKSKQVSCTVPAEYFDGLEDYFWTNRIKVTDIVRKALDQFVAENGIKIDGSAPHAK